MADFYEQYTLTGPHFSSFVFTDTLDEEFIMVHSYTYTPDQ